MADLQKARMVINEVDEKIASNFVERMKAVEEVIAYKIENDLPIFDSKREEEVIQKNLSYLKNKDYRFVLEGFFRNLMNLSKLIQNEENHR